MRDDRKCDIRKSLRLPSFLVNDIQASSNVQKCKTTSDKYRLFLEIGLQTFDEMKRSVSDPKYKERATSELEAMFKDGFVVENLMRMDASKLRGLGMAVDLVRGKRQV